MRIQNKLTKKFLTVKNNWNYWTNEGNIFTPEEIEKHLYYFNNSKRLIVVK